MTDTPKFLSLAREGPRKWNDWRKRYPHEVIDFSGVDFTLEENRGISFSGFEFGNDARFQGAKFGDNFQFDKAKLGNNTRFDKATFGDSIHFNGSVFGQDTFFGGAILATISGSKIRRLKVPPRSMTQLSGMERGLLVQDSWAAPRSTV